MAKFYLKNNSKNKIITLLGDGELNEGSIWESLFLAINWKLNNLIIIIDKNKYQANEETRKVLKINNEKKYLKIWVFKFWNVMDIVSKILITNLKKLKIQNQ